MDKSIYKDVIEEHQSIITKLADDLFYRKITFDEFYQKIEEEKRRFENLITHKE